MIEQAQARVHRTDGPTMAEVRRAQVALVAALDRHLAALSALPGGPTSFARLSDLHQPVLHAVARWDQAVYEHTGTFPVGVDDGWTAELVD